jgi:multidrug efflux pump subunit AcrA (membrane-fusion protein)
MTAQVDIDADTTKEVLTVPASAVIYPDRRPPRVAVKTGEGAVVWRELSLGRSNGKLVEVRRGLKAGEQVVLEPLKLREERKNEEPSPPPTGPASSPKR